MTSYSLTHLSDQALLGDLAALVAQDRVTTAALLAHLAEVDARKLYLPAAYPSMYAYCVGELRLSEDAAYKRIRAARAARQSPSIFDAVAQGRLHVSGVCLLAPYLTSGNATNLLEAAMDKSKAQIEELLAGRFPRTEMLPMVHAIPAASPRLNGQLAPGLVEGQGPAPERGQEMAIQLAPGRVGTPASRAEETLTPRTQVTPVGPERFVLQVTIGKATQGKLLYLQALLSHEIPSGDLAQLLDHCLDTSIRVVERRKFAKTEKPRSISSQPLRNSRRTTAAPRYIPADVKRAVWERDGGQCTFLCEAGRRCPARKFLEFDHVDLVARGGKATVERMRLRCRAHNQYAAEREFGVEFMERKRQKTRRAAAMQPPRRDSHQIPRVGSP